MSEQLIEKFHGWSRQDLANLAAILNAKDASPDGLAYAFKWLFRSRSAAHAEVSARNLAARIRGNQPTADVDTLYPTPTYSELLHGSCDHMACLGDAATEPEKELYLSHAVIIMALKAMSPRARSEFFAKSIDLDAITMGAPIPRKGRLPPLATLAALGAAQVSGFGIYLASTSALGLLTHAVGVALPFAFYTGMSSTIAFLIGPAGWLGVGLWGGWRAIQPDWRKIIAGVIFIIARDARSASLAVVPL